MPGNDDQMDLGNEASAQSAASHDERVWSALQPGLEELKGDIVALVPAAQIKAQIRKKFEAKEKALKAVLAEKLVEVVSIASVPKAPERSALPTRVNIGDLKANLGDEWSGSLRAIVEFVQANHANAGFLEELAAKHDLYERKIDASFAGFEQQVLDRFQAQGAFGPLEFDRPSMEADFPFDSDPISRARTDSLSGKLSKAQLRIEQQEQHLQHLDQSLKEKAQEYSELQKQLVPLSNVASVLGCEAAKVQQGVFDLDHSACTTQINDLELQLLDMKVDLQREQQNVASSTRTIKDLRDVVQSLRDELQKHGVRQPLEYRLQQLGFTSGSGDDVGSSGTTSSTNRYGRDDDNAQ